MDETKPRIAVHKFTSCDGCQLAFLNAGEDLLALAERVNIVHFAEAGPIDPDAQVDIAFIEGSVSTPDEIERINRIRERSRYLIIIGACATSGGLQALRNLASAPQWLSAVYPDPQHVASLDTSTPISRHVKVDLELWGCPVSTRQIIAALSALLNGVDPTVTNQKLCMECKRDQAVCVMVARGTACLGPVTRSGCGALCPQFERGCYGCYGPSENPNAGALTTRFAGLGLVGDDIARLLLSYHSAAPEFFNTGVRWLGSGDE
ncbi:MAG: sulfhydrogenase subunit delta [Pseudomonadota bacterium]|nr:MAG: sulfhydrogenase subunit delta [Pseudomonadota bacterium]